jgi:HK97 family phage major capsid protein/HK97 family phage prohead protease
MRDRAYSLLTIKSVDAEQRVLTGLATTPSTDSYGDIVEPDGAEFKLPLPLLWQHDGKSPIGEVFHARVMPDGIEIKARIAKTDTPGAVKNRLDDAWESLKLGLVKGLSIGFSSLEESFNKDTGGYRFLRWAWRELSCVTIPANADCSIATIKSLDTRATSGATEKPAGVSASSRVVSTRRDKPMKKSYADMIADCLASRKEKTDTIDSLLMKSGEAGVTLDETEQEQHDTLSGEVDQLDKQLVRLRAADAREKAAAAPVAGRTPAGASEERGATRITVTPKALPPGISFARYAMCMAASRGNPYEAKQIAREHYGDDDAYGLLKLIDLHTKTAVGAVNAQTAGAGSELVPYNIMDDFINYLRPQTILGKFGTTMQFGSQSVVYPSLRRVPFNTRVSGFSAGATAAWVGEGLPALLSKQTSTSITLTWSKLASLVVLTKEEIRFSNPSAEAKVRDDIAAALIAKQDLDFIDPVRVAVANVSPASITWNTTPVLTTGTTAATFRTDMATLLATFATALLDPSDITIIMSTVDALNMSLAVSSLGNPLYPGLTMGGGYLFGFPVITTKAMVSIGSPVSTIIVAVKAGDIYLADDGVVTVDASDQASVEMVDSSSQSGLTGTGASLVSFWQSGLLGLKATREINWKLRRTGAARYIYNSAYKA